jgi:HlyD family secretion protein
MQGLPVAECGVTVGKSTQDLQQLLEDTSGPRRTRVRRVVLYAALGLAALAALAGLWHVAADRAPATAWITEPAAIGTLVVTVSATGTLQPTKSVDVGSELSGTVARVLVDENDVVKQGQLLAELDTARLADAVIRSEAAVAAAVGQVAQTRATVAEAEATQRRLHRLSDMSHGDEPARQELDTADAAVQRARANADSAQAQEAQARAALKTDRTNLGKAQIRSPVDGVVLTRKVEPGNTVVAAMNTPVLFTVAEDLTRMELQVKVDEADVAGVRPGQPADFTVAAWPGRRFPATIRRVGLGSTMTDNVVTYKTVLEVANPDLALRPGMTATATIVTARRDNVLLVPNAALRFTPPNTRAGGGSFVSNLLPRPPAGARRRTGAGQAEAAHQVWTPGPDGPRAIAVRTGLSNGRVTEVTGGDLAPGTAVITDVQEAAK